MIHGNDWMNAYTYKANRSCFQILRLLYLQIVLVLLDFRWTLKCEINSRIRKLSVTCKRYIIPFSLLPLIHPLLPPSLSILWCSSEKEVSELMLGETVWSFWITERIKYNHGEYMRILLWSHNKRRFLKISCWNIILDGIYSFLYIR